MRLPGPVARRLEAILARFWTRETPVTVIPQNQDATAPTDNMQRSMNLVMPLKDTTAVGRAKLVRAIASSGDEITSGLNNVGTVHVARFDIIAGNLCMLSVYDGDFTNYIRDFIVAFGSVFDALMGFVKDPPPVPTREHPQTFIDWVLRHDILQVPNQITALLPPTHDILGLPRELVEVMERNPSMLLGIYHAYPGVSAAQIRDSMGMGW